MFTVRMYYFRARVHFHDHVHVHVHVYVHVYVHLDQVDLIP
jgi:hypothetical protein